MAGRRTILVSSKIRSIKKSSYGLIKLMTVIHDGPQQMLDRIVTVQMTQQEAMKLKEAIETILEGKEFRVDLE